MKVEKAGDLIHWTYFMMDWKSVQQRPSGQVCVQCGGEMQGVGPAEDPKGGRYLGLACHSCKRLIWIREG